ncbi:MAG: hypothetical protein HY360_08625 [Verrucomicrobia bacterium]|nr:hypothetical protein [Verrucomicrobiota bacterium]
MRINRLVLRVLALCLAPFALAQGSAAKREAENRNDRLAPGKFYTMNPHPNYDLCTDEADRIQLTDGKTFGSSWGLKTTVGWMNPPNGQVQINLDLGMIAPIRGVSVSSAGGDCGVSWPSAIFVLVSDDNRHWHSLGDLTALSAVYGVPPETGQASHRYWTDRLKAHGRYIQFLVNANPFFFTDEIDVYRGEDAWLKSINPGPAIDSPEKYFAGSSVRTQSGIQRRLFIDLRRSRDQLEQSATAEPLKSQWRKELDEVEKEISRIPPVDDPGKFRAIFPLNGLHARIFAVHGALAKAAGAAPLTVWTTHRYDFLTPTQPPPARMQASISISAMKAETRSATFNLTNATEKPMTVTVRLEGLPGGPNPDYITIHQVEWTDTQSSVPVAAALLPITRKDKGYPITVPAGMTRQVWVNCTPREVTAGKHRGQLVIERPKAPALEVPLTLRVFNETFPEAPLLHVGGFDYTNTDWLYGLTPKNIEPLIAHLRTRYVDTTWATSDVFLPAGVDSPAVLHSFFDANGKMVKKPDTANFDRWVGRWPGARRYAVFFNVLDCDNLAGLKCGTPAFNRAAGQWVRFWVEHAGSKGIQPEQILLLLVDEPGNHDMDQRTIDWAKPIRAAQTGVLIWTDPTWGPDDWNPQRKPQDALLELWPVVDVICPLRAHLLRGGEGFADFYREQLMTGHPLEFYSCNGPASALDPYSYYRLQAWTCFDMGATGVSFWSFGCSGKKWEEEGSSWNQYITTGNSDSPLYLGPDSATAAKQMEGIREGVQDYQYLVMLRDRIRQTEKANARNPMLAEARSLLSNACSRVLHDQEAQDGKWISNKDRSIADQVCVEIGVMLEKMGKP